MTSPAAPAGLGHVPVLLKEAMQALDASRRRAFMSTAPSAPAAIRARCLRLARA